MEGQQKEERRKNKGWMDGMKNRQISGGVEEQTHGWNGKWREEGTRKMMADGDGWTGAVEGTRKMMADGDGQEL